MNKDIKIIDNFLPSAELIELQSQFKKSFTAIYYLNTNNGYTKFEDGTKIESIENKFVVFPNTLKHTSATTSDRKIRVVLVFNFF